MDSDSIPSGNDGLQADRQTSARKNLTLKPLMIKQYEGHNAARYGRIGQIENRREEYEVLSTYKRHPRGPVPRHEGKIEHIHNATPEEHVVAETPRREVGYSRRVRGVEDDTVEDAINDVAQRTRRD